MRINLQMNNNPVVSIICLTYNQEKFVRDCLDGFMAQKTDFPFEILIYDDASTDSTPDIIREYAEKHPDVFKPTFYTTNNYSQGLGFVGLYTGIKEARGKYVAYCEGDDYWTDPFKLQKQVAFLDANHRFAICAHETSIKYNSGSYGLFRDLHKDSFVPLNKRTYTFDDALAGNLFHISSLMYRNQGISLPPWISRVSACDMVLFKMLAREGDIYVLPDIMSVYREHSDSLTNSSGEYSSVIRFYELSIQVLRLMNRYWNREYQARFYPLISRYYVECALACIHRRNYALSKAKEAATLSFYYDKRTFVKFFLKGLIKKIIH